MTISELSQLITALAALGAMVMSIRNGRKIKEVHISINSRMDRLLRSENAVGRQQQREEDIFKTNVNPK